MKFDTKLQKNLRNQDILVFVKHNSAMRSFKIDKKLQQKMQHETKTLQGKKLVPDNTATTQKYDEGYYHQL